MTFHQRARMLKALAQYLMERKDEFYAVSAATGATKSDSWVDIDGGIGTFFAYASQGRREFPDETLLRRRRDSSRSRKGGTFVGRHICVPLEGVAVHINAFNFPVLGHAGEARADVPRRHAGDREAGDGDVATSPRRWSRAMIESSILPDGRAPAHLRQRRRPARSPRTARTPSRSPARRRPGGSSRRHARSSSTVGALQHGSRLAQLLHARSRRARPAREEFDLFVKEVVREMTVKAGQKCTAIRRTIVPERDGRRRRSAR